MSDMASPFRSPLDRPDWPGALERTEDECRRVLGELRWPEGVHCPRCNGHSISSIPARRRFNCRRCRHFFSLTSGTAFHNSHLPIWKWFLTIELLLESEQGVPANELRKLLGGSYKSAWFIEHRIREALPGGGARRDARRRTPNSAAARSYARSLVGRHHQLALKYLTSYQAETCWRARERSNPDALRDTLLLLLDAKPVSLDELTATPNARTPQPNELKLGR
jgi:transposase-like protein